MLDLCEKAAPGNYFDGGGLHLVVQPDGKQYWRMTCYVNGKRKLLSFGSYERVTLAQARDKRKEAQDLIDKGIDPIDPIEQAREKKQQQLNASRKEAYDKGNTFAQVTKRLIDSKRPNTTQEH